MGPYTPNPANFPTSIQLFQDGDKPNAANMRPGIEAALDMAMYLRDGNVTYSGTKTFSTSGQWLRRVFQTGSGGTVAVPVHEYVRIPGTLGSAIAITLKSTSPVPPVGSFIVFKRIRLPGAGAPSNHTVTIQREDLTPLATMNVSVDSWVAFEFGLGFIGEWTVGEFGPGVTIL